MPLDTRNTFEIAASPVRLAKMFLFSILVVAASIGLIVYAWGTPGANSLLVLSGIFILLCSTSGAFSLWRLFKETGTVIELHPEGIRDFRVAAEIIPWSAVKNLYTVNYPHHNVMVLSISNEVGMTLTLSQRERLVRKVYTSPDVYEIRISDLGLMISYEKLEEVTLQYLLTWQISHESS